MPICGKCSACPSLSGSFSPLVSLSLSLLLSISVFKSLFIFLCPFLCVCCIHLPLLTLSSLSICARAHTHMHAHTCTRTRTHTSLQMTAPGYTCIYSVDYHDFHVEQALRKCQLNEWKVNERANDQVARLLGVPNYLDSPVLENLETGLFPQKNATLFCRV